MPRFFNIPKPTKLGRTELQESDPRKATEIMMLSMESRLNSSGTQLCGKVNDLLSDLGEAPETFTRTILFMSMFNDIACDKKGNDEKISTSFRRTSHSKMSTNDESYCKGVVERVILGSDCQGSQDKQQTQYRLIPK